MGNAYELHQHERLSVKRGFGEDWVAAVERLSPDDALLLSDEERAVQRLVMAMVERHGVGISREIKATVERDGAVHLNFVHVVGAGQVHVEIAHFDVRAEAADVCSDQLVFAWMHADFARQ